MTRDQVSEAETAADYELFQELLTEIEECRESIATHAHAFQHHDDPKSNRQHTAHCDAKASRHQRIRFSDLQAGVSVLPLARYLPLGRTLGKCCPPQAGGLVRETSIETDLSVPLIDPDVSRKCICRRCRREDFEERRRLLRIPRYLLVRLFDLCTKRRCFVFALCESPEVRRCSSSCLTIKSCDRGSEWSSKASR